MDLDSIARALKELGHTTRLSVYKTIANAGTDGIPVGAIKEVLGIPDSTLSHHISRLVSAKLVIQRRDGRTLFCIAKYQNFNSVVNYLKEECYADEKRY